jgi:hypothetical protein
VTAEGELRVEELLAGLESQLVEAVGVLGREVEDVGERRAAPEVERGAEHRRPRGGRLGAGLLDELLEADGVDRGRVERQRVAGAPGRDRRDAEGLAELRDVALERGACGRRRLLAPERLDEAVGGDDGARADGQERQGRALLGAAEPDRGAVGLGRDGPEQA